MENTIKNLSVPLDLSSLLLIMEIKRPIIAGIKEIAYSTLP